MSEIAEIDPRRSALQRGGWRGRAGSDFRWWLGGKLQFQLIQQEAELGFGLGIAGEQQLAAVGGRQVHHFIRQVGNNRSWRTATAETGGDLPATWARMRQKPIAMSTII